MWANDVFLSGPNPTGDLTDGSANLFVNSISVNSLDPSKPIRTTESKELASSLLPISDIVNLQSELNSKISNPLQSSLDGGTFNITNISNTEYVKSSSTTAPPPGQLQIYANNDDTFHYVNSVGGDKQFGNFHTPAQEDLDMDGKSIDNLLDTNMTNQPSSTTPAVGDTKIYGSSVDCLPHSIQEDGTDLPIVNNIDTVLTTLYDFSTTTTSPPLAGQVRLNNSTYSLVTEIYASDTNKKSVDVSSFLAKIDDEEYIYIQDKSNNDNAMLYLINTTSDEGDHYKFTVSFEKEVTGSLILEGETVIFAFGEPSLISKPDISSTGIIRGGVLSIGAPTTNYNISSGVGKIWTENGDYLTVSWDDLVVPYPPGETDIYVSISSTGTPIWTNVLITSTQQRDSIFLGEVFSADTTTVLRVLSYPTTLEYDANSLRDLSDALGIFVINGLVFMGESGGNLEIQYNSGNVYKAGIDYPNIKDPNKLFLPAVITPPFTYAKQDGLIPPINGTTLIDPTNYDDGGTILNCPGGANVATIQRIYISLTNDVVVYYGQTVYATLSEALNKIASDPFTSSFDFSSSILRAFLVVRCAGTDLTDTGDAVFVTPDRFGSVSGSTTTSSIASLQQTYENSSQPQITTNPSLGSVVYQRGSLADTDNVFEIQNGSPATTFSITGEGKLSIGLSGADYDLPITRSTNPGYYLSDTLADGVVDFKPAMNWKGEWIQQEYNEMNVVKEAGYTMVANKVTEDYPAPQPIGEESYVYGLDNLLALQENTKSLLFGSRYNNPDEALFIKGWRIYTTVGNKYVVYLVEDPLGADKTTQILSFTSTTDGWNTFNSDVLIAQNTTLDLVAVVQEPDPTPTITTTSYDYLLTTNVTPPALGQITHASKDLQTLSINKTDDNSVDRTTLLLNLAIGDIINGASQNWSVQSKTDQGAYWDFTIAPASQGFPAGVQDFDFQTVDPTPITYDRDLDYWAVNPNVSGLISLTGDYDSKTVDNSQYGMDLKIQEVNISEDWDVMAVSATTGGGGSGGTEPVVNPYAVFRKTGTQSITSGVTTAVILDDAGELKLDGITHAPNSTQLVVPQDGYYAVTYETFYEPSTSADMRFSYVAVNGNIGTSDPRYARFILRAPGGGATASGGSYGAIQRTASGYIGGPSLSSSVVNYCVNSDTNIFTGTLTQGVSSGQPSILIGTTGTYKLQFNGQIQTTSSFTSNPVVYIRDGLTIYAEQIYNEELTNQSTVVPGGPDTFSSGNGFFSLSTIVNLTAGQNINVGITLTNGGASNISSYSFTAEELGGGGGGGGSPEKMSLTATAVLPMNSGDYVEFYTSHSAGSPLNFGSVDTFDQPEFSLLYSRPL